jgi:hypothetical protein
MKRTALFVLGVVAVSTSAFAQAPPTVPADPIGRPLAAAPANMRRPRRSSSGNSTHPRHVESGTNRLVCYDRSGFLSSRRSARVHQHRQHRPGRAESEGRGVMTRPSQAMLDGWEKDGTRGSLSSIGLPPGWDPTWNTRERI